MLLNRHKDIEKLKKGIMNASIKNVFTSFCTQRCVDTFDKLC